MRAHLRLQFSLRRAFAECRVWATNLPLDPWRGNDEFAQDLLDRCATTAALTWRRFQGVIFELWDVGLCSEVSHI